MESVWNAIIHVITSWVDLLENDVLIGEVPLADIIVGISIVKMILKFAFKHKKNNGVTENGGVS